MLQQCSSYNFIACRSIYRIIEFSDGYNGKIAHTQVLFSELLRMLLLFRISPAHIDVFDGMMVTLAMYTLNAMHPGMLLRATAGVSAYAMAQTSLTSFDRRTSPTVEAYQSRLQK